MPALDKLIEISGPGLIPLFPDGGGLKDYGAIGEELEALLRRPNGFFAFESALHRLGTRQRRRPGRSTTDRLHVRTPST